MRTFTSSLIYAIVLVSLCAVASAQTTYTFLSSDGTWATPTNWDPTGTPVAGDTAVIPNGKTCRIEADAAAGAVDIQSGGTLRISSATLTVSSGSTLTVDGTLQFLQSAATAPALLYLDGNLTIGGSGTINASDSGGFGPGHVGNASGADGNLTFSSGLDVKGSVRIDIDGNLTINADFITDDPQDEMHIGPVNSGSSRGLVFGAGTMRALAGTIKIGRMELAREYAGVWTGTIVAGNNGGDRGTFHVTGFLPSQYGAGFVHLYGGATIKVDTAWFSYGDFHLTDGQIQVAAGAGVRFEESN